MIVVSVLLLAMLGIAGACFMTISAWWNRKTEHTQQVNSVAFSPDGKLIVTGSSDNTIKVWDTSSGRQTLAVPSVLFRVNSVAFSADGKWIIAGGVSKDDDSGVIKVFDSQNGKEITSIVQERQRVTSVAFSSDGKHIAAGHEGNFIEGDAKSGGAVIVWDAKSGRKTKTMRQPEPNSFLSVAYSPDSKRIVSGDSRKAVIVWDAESGQEILTLVGHQQQVVSVAFRADGKRIVSAERGRDIKIWDSESGEELLTLRGHQGTVNSVAFSPNGKHIVSGSSRGEDQKTGTRPGEIKVWDAETGKETLNIQGHKGAVQDVKYSPDGQRIVSAGGGSGPERRVLGSFIPWGEIKIWDAESGREVLTLGKQ